MIRAVSGNYINNNQTQTKKKKDAMPSIHQTVVPEIVCAAEKLYFFHIPPIFLLLL